MLITEHSSCLVVIDSIGSLLRKEYDTRTSQGIVDRSSAIARLAAQLK